MKKYDYSEKIRLIKVEKEAHKKLKMYSAKEEMTIGKYINYLINEYENKSLVEL